KLLQRCPKTSGEPSSCFSSRAWACTRSANRLSRARNNRHKVPEERVGSAGALTCEFGNQGRSGMRIVLLLILFVATAALAQQSLKINEPVERQLASGSVQSYAIALKAGDYVAGLLDQHGRTDLTIVAP